LEAEGWQGQLFDQCAAAITETSAPISKSPQNVFHLRKKSKKKKKKKEKSHFWPIFCYLLNPVGMVRGPESSISPWGTS
jgi:hypothetical protein